MAGEALPKPKAKPDDDLTQHPAYDLGLRHAFSGIAKNPFADGGSLLDEAAPGGASATLPRKPNPVVQTPPANSAPARTPTADANGRLYPPVPASTSTTTSAPGRPAPDIVGEANRRSNLPSSDPNSLSPFRTGFFNPRPVQAPRVTTGAPIDNIPRAAGPEPAVGGQRAILPAVGNRGTLTVNPRGSRDLSSPYGGGTTTFDASKGTRKPFIAGANGENVAGDFVAGGRFSSAKAGTDDTLDKDYVAGLPRTRNQRAVTTQPRKAFFSGG